MPDTIASRGPSGRFLLRIDPALHAVLRDAARAAGLALNDYCARKLAAPGADPSGPGTDVVRRAAAVTGGSLVGVVAYGSWARGEEGDASDVDVLVVVPPALDLTRGLYRGWDAAPLTWAGRRVEAHFARLPGADDPITALWAEIAIDGIVLFDHDHRLSRRLARIRRRIAAGELTLRRAQGQPYWAGAA